MGAVDEQMCKERTQRIEQKIDGLSTQIDNVVTMLKGPGSDPGVVDKVRDLERAQSRLTKGFWIAFAAITAQGIAHVRRMLFGG